MQTEAVHPCRCFDPICRIWGCANFGMMMQSESELWDFGMTASNYYKFESHLLGHAWSAVRCTTLISTNFNFWFLCQSISNQEQDCWFLTFFSVFTLTASRFFLITMASLQDRVLLQCGLMLPNLLVNVSFPDEGRLNKQPSLPNPAFVSFPFYF